MGEDTPALYVGVDVGGTNIAAALVRESGEVVARGKRRTPQEGTPGQSLEQILGAIDDVLGEAKVAADGLTGIGLGIAGPVEPETGRVVKTPNMNLGGLQVVAPVEERFGVPAALGNDVNVGTLGEWWLGAARGARSAFGIFVGTGIGGGLIIDGKLVTGARNAAAEVGHMVMELDGPLCGCGNRGCFEAMASRTAIERDIREAIDSGRESAIAELLDGDLSRVKSGALKKALAAGDGLVTEVMNHACEVLGYACLSVQHLIDPEVIVLGGGVVEACGDFVMPIVEKILREDPFLGGQPGGRVVESQLGDDAGVLGAVALAMARLGRMPEAALTDPLPHYPTIQGTEFGSVTIDGRTYEKDVCIRAGGKVKRRKKKPVKAQYGTSHKIGPAELNKVCKGDPELLVVGTGQSGSAALTPDGAEFLAEHGIRVVAVPTPRAIEEFNRAEGRKAALLHVTC
jgi:glucokinase